VVVAKHLVIVGNSAAALAAVRAIRGRSDDHKITLIAREECGAYSPVLTTYYLKGRIAEQDLFICDEAFYRSHRVELRLGRAAVGLDPARQEVALDDGGRVAYDELLIATGASPRRLDIVEPGLEAQILSLRTIEDARRIRERSAEARELVVVGGGLVGLQVAAAMARPGLKVTCLISSQQILSQNIDKASADLVQGHMERNADICFRFGATPKSISPAAAGCSVLLESGEELRADTVVVGKGIVPNIGFVDADAIGLRTGVPVDRAMRTTLPNVFAAGDVTEDRNLLTGRLEPVANWINAGTQGAVAGLNMAGGKAEHPGSIPENITTMFGLPVVSLGITRPPKDDPAYEELSLLREDRGFYRKLVLRAGHLVGAVLVGEVGDAGVLRDEIVRGGGLGVPYPRAVRGEVSFADRLKACRFGSAPGRPADIGK
jgi:NAD(P)H-nitrite reductase large subunit